MSGCTLLAPSRTGWGWAIRCPAESRPAANGARCTIGAKVRTQAMLMLAGGGEACADIEKLRAQPDLFGSVPSDSTLYRTFRHDIDPSTLKGLSEGMGQVRASVWRRSSATTGTGTVV